VCCSEIRQASALKVSQKVVVALALLCLAALCSMPACWATQQQPQHTGNAEGEAIRVPSGPATGKVIWEEDFGDPDLPEWSTGFYSPSPDYPKGERTLKVVEGNLVFSSTFPAPRSQRGYASTSYTFHNGGKGFPLASAPVLEIRMRVMEGAGTTLILHYETFGGDLGSTASKVVQRPRLPHGTWYEVRLNMYNDPLASGPGAWKYLRRFTLYLFSSAPAGEAVSLEIDWIRLREMTADQWESINRYLGPLREFKMQPCPRAENFFGLGFYGIWNSSWGGGVELTLDHMARNWVNLILPMGSRFGDVMQWGHQGRGRYDPNKSLQENLVVSDTWLDIQRESLDLLKPYGIKYVANMQRFTGGPTGTPVEDMNRDQLALWADEVTSALRNEESILGWYIGDEVRSDFLKKYLVAKEFLESRDRGKTAVVLVNGIDSVKTFGPHHQVIVSDHYPVGRPRSDEPWRITWWMDEVRKASGDKPHWIVLQAMRETNSPWGGNVTATELRMMSWLAAAGGGDAMLYFLYSGSPWWRAHYVQRKRGGFWCMVDEYGNPLPLWQEFERFAEKVGPLAGLMAGARVVEDHGLEAVAPTITLKTLNNVSIRGSRRRPAIYLNALRLRGMDALLVFTVNIDREDSHTVQVTGTADALADRRLYDLASLKSVDREGGRFSWGRLLPGDGHAFALATQDEFEHIRESIHMARARQALRVAKLDVRKAERWGIDVTSLRRHMEETRRAVADDPEGALGKAEKVSRSAQSALEEHPVYLQAAPLLEQAQEALGRIEILLNLSIQARPEDDPAIKPTVERVLELSEGFSALKRQLYFGETEGLIEGVRGLVPQVEQALAEVKEVTGLTVPEPIYPVDPWNHPELFE